MKVLPRGFPTKTQTVMSSWWWLLHENILENTVHFDSNYIVALFFIILSHQATFIFNKDHGRWNSEIDISYRWVVEMYYSFEGFKPWKKIVHDVWVGFWYNVFPKIVGFSPPKSSILIGVFLLQIIHFGVLLFLETPIYIILSNQY